MDQVKHFFETYYHPSNAILTVGGNFENAQIEDLVQKWYGDIPGKTNRHESFSGNHNKPNTALCPGTQSTDACVLLCV